MSNNNKTITKRAWIRSGENFNQTSINSEVIEEFPRGVFNIEVDSFGNFSLQRIAEKFQFDYKVYALEEEFCNYVKTTFNNTTGNLGILLNGTKGTGKTVTAKSLANDFGLPIILVKNLEDYNQRMIEFIESFGFDAVLFFDEFEKNFNENDSTVLQIMDGVYNSKFRKIFLLTTNELTVNDNLISRPSRVRFIKEFGNLKEEVVREFLNDTLNDKQNIEEVVEFINTLQISTVDILKSIVSEINIHGFEEFNKVGRKFLNVKSDQYRFDVRSVNISDNIALKLGTKDGIDIKKFLEGEEYYEKILSFRSKNSYGDEYDKIVDGIEDDLVRTYATSIRFESFFADKKFDKLKVGDCICSSSDYDDEDCKYEILEIDHKNKVFVAKYIYNGSVMAAHVTDIYKPSLYTKQKIWKFI